jgi:hypothetical protein
MNNTTISPLSIIECETMIDEDIESHINQVEYGPEEK